LWGLLPIYWKTLSVMPAQEILVMRMILSLLFLGLVLAVRRQWAWTARLREPRVFFTFLATAALLTANWYIYIWGVNAGFIIETSLGYFITPLINVLLGVIFLKERPRPWQWIALGIAATGVIYQTISYGALPWIGLTLAFSFGTYGLLRKTAALGSLEGLSTEMALMFVPALAYLIYLSLNGQSAFFDLTVVNRFVLLAVGVVTAIPLLLFAAGARQIPMITLGVLQYIAPTLQFLIGVLVYGEAFTPIYRVSYGLIWVALIVYTVEGFLVARRQARRRRAAKFQPA
jgi:chloramphenicol-sensitive protein RarD